MKELYARVLPGMGAARAADVPGHSYFVIGPEKQFAAYETFLKDRVWRLYPRDFWMVASN